MRLVLVGVWCSLALRVDVAASEECCCREGECKAADVVLKRRGARFEAAGLTEGLVQNVRRSGAGLRTFCCKMASSRLPGRSCPVAKFSTHEPLACARPACPPNSRREVGSLTHAERCVCEEPGFHGNVEYDWRRNSWLGSCSAVPPEPGPPGSGREAEIGVARRLADDLFAAAPTKVEGLFDGQSRAEGDLSGGAWRAVDDLFGGSSRSSPDHSPEARASPDQSGPARLADDLFGGPSRVADDLFGVGASRVPPQRRNEKFCSQCELAYLAAGHTLSVTTNAAGLKKAYLKAARTLHPDKTGEHPERGKLVQQFHVVTHCYQHQEGGIDKNYITCCGPSSIWPLQDCTTAL